MTGYDQGPGNRYYRHPQGSTITVYPDGGMYVRNAAGRYKRTSATPESLAAGHGRWQEVFLTASGREMTPEEITDARDREVE